MGSVGVIAVKESVASTASGQLLRVAGPGLTEHADYPLPDKAHARVALARTVNDHTLTPAQKKAIRARARAILDDATAPERHMQESQQADKSINIKLVETLSFDNDKRVADVVILTDGVGNGDDNHYYYPATVVDAATNKVFDGEQAYADHPGLDEDVNRPERSIRDLIGYYFDSRVGDITFNGVKRKAYLAKLQIFDGPSYDWIVTLIKESIKFKKMFPSKTLLGISINADGKTAPGTNPENGKPTNGVTQITRAFSADVVTKPARGGSFVALKESHGGSSNNTRLGKDNGVEATLLEAARTLQTQIAGGEVDKDALVLLVNSILKEADKPKGKDEADLEEAKGKTDPRTAAINAASAATAAAAKTAADADDNEDNEDLDEAKKVKESFKSFSVDDIKKFAPSVFEAALKEAQKVSSTDIAELKAENAKLKTEQVLRESAERATTKLRESGLPRACASKLMHQLVGKSAPEQDQLIEAEVAYTKELGIFDGQRIKGAGETVQLRESETKANATLLFAGMGDN